VLVVASLLVAGCELLAAPQAQGGPYPGACAALGFPARQCAAIVAQARTEAGVNAADVAATDVLPASGDDTMRLGGQLIARVRFHFAGGASRQLDVWCVGIGSPADRVCSNDPHIMVARGEGDHDVPCPDGVALEVCASEPPQPGPAAVARARPLRVAALDVPIDHLGPYEIKVGNVGLPNGYVSRHDLRLLDDSPEEFWIDRGIRLELRPIIAGRPAIGNVHRDAFDGTEPAAVFLVFEVSDLSPGGVLRVRDIDVE